MPPALPWLHRGTTAATRGVAPRAVARNGRAAPRTARVTCRASNMVLEVMRVATGGHDIQKTRAAIADTRCRAKHFANLQTMGKKRMLREPDTAGVRPKARDASRRARVRASRGVLV